jgi:hypothetical protein
MASGPRTQPHQQLKTQCARRNHHESRFFRSLLEQSVLTGGRKNAANSVLNANSAGGDVIVSAHNLITLIKRTSLNVYDADIFNCSRQPHNRGAAPDPTTKPYKHCAFTKGASR